MDPSPLGEHFPQCFMTPMTTKTTKKKNILPMELYNLAQCSTYNDQATEKWNQHDNIITWLRYHLLEIYNIDLFGIYNDNHTWIYTYTKTHLPSPQNNEGYITHIWSTIYHVASSGPTCSQWNLTCSIARFHSMRIFCCNM